LLAAWRAWLQRCFALNDLLIGAPVTLRRDSATANMLGCMVNNVVFRNPGNTQRSFRELLQAEREVALAAYEHSTVPFEKIVEAVQPARTLGRHPLFQVLFMFEDRSAPAARAGGLRFSGDVLPVDRASYWDLELSVTDCGIGKVLPAFLGIRADLFDTAALATWPEGFVAMLEALATDPDTAVAQLPLLSAARQRQMLSEWNATHMPVAPDQTLHGLFAAQAARSPASIAVQDERETLTYAELLERATRYAAVLGGHGVIPGSRVALSVTRSGDSIALLLAVLQRGACWLPLDPAYPAARLALMIADAQPALIISDGNRSFATDRTVLGLADLHAMATAATGSTDAVVATAGADSAYILFTSGSTGRPKGALSTHAGAVSRCLWMWREFRFTTSDVFAQRTSLNFVDSVWEIFGPLLHGARLVVLPAAQEQDPAAILRWLQQEQITHLVTVPVLLDALLMASARNGVPAALRSVISSGEALHPRLAQRCAEVWPQAALINTYGTSETWDASYFRVSAPQRMRVIPIGKPVANAELYILDAGGQPVPPGVIGELHVGGLALAREYVGNPELTRERFVIRSFAGVPAVRLYRTGDLASYSADGNIILAGRADRQIKLRGLRIDPADVESPALAYPGVRQCALRVQQPADGEPWLALYVAADAAPFDTQGLREYLQTLLPRAMVPADICVLEQLPLTPSGKLDANALPDLATPAAAAGLYVAPRDSVEESLAAIWQDALGVAQVSVHDNFFALRGHSLLAVQVIARISDQFALELPLQALFETPTIAGLARSIAALRWTRPGQLPREGFADDDREVLRL
jgi:amino acid adenylation domain-containing protein